MSDHSKILIESQTAPNHELFSEEMGVHETTPPSQIKRSIDNHSRIFQSVKEYVKETQGKRVIETVLIANNGISAVKAIRSIRSWSYEMFADEHKVRFVVMATPEDLRANAEYIRMAEHVVEVPGGANNNNYANVGLIVETAERYEVDAVWAGWGHASENPLLPDALSNTERQIVFIGPPSQPMRALGDKIGSTIIAQSARVPTIAWNGDGIYVDYKEKNAIPDEIYQSAQINNGAHCLQECKRIGFPVMIKASEGGGGRGIRKVTEESQVHNAWEAVRGELPGSPVFVMKLAPKSRHLEVQLLADEYGNAIALSGRDCSVQRRHQKIVEEGPVLAPSPAIWGEMMKAATRLAKEVQYVNAGTVEYLFSERPEDQENPFFFLELNPRLQVEHPVTEMITHVNLPAAQLQVAMGIPLSYIPDIRRLYDHDGFGKEAIDFDTEQQLPPHGHVIAARITAEDPNAGFQPTSGAIKELNFRSTPDVWGYFSVDSSGLVHEFADSQIGHLFAWGTTRDRARQNMILALKELSIRGDIHTTVEYIVNMMESEDFRLNKIDTTWLDDRIARHKEVRLQGRPDPLMVVMVGAVCSAYQSANARIEEFVSQLERGQLPSSSLLKQCDDLKLIYEGIKYQIKAHRSGQIWFTLECNDSYVQVEIRTLSDGGFLILLNGKSHVAYATKEAQGLRLVVNGHTCVFTNEYDPTRLVTNTAGKLARYLVNDNSRLRRGTPYAEIEVMKMYMPLLAQEDGTIKFMKSEGAVLAPGDCIAMMDLDDPSCVKKSECYSGKVPKKEMAPEHAMERKKPLHKFRWSLETIKTALDGFYVPDDFLDRSFNDLFDSLNNPHLPVEEIKEYLSPLAGLIPLEYFARINDALHQYRTKVSDSSDCKVEDFNVNDVEVILHQYKASLDNDRAKSDFEATVLGLKTILAKYRNGLISGYESVIAGFINQYLVVEKAYANTQNLEDVITALRHQYTDDLVRVFAIARAHRELGRRTKLLLRILEFASRQSSKLVKAPSIMPLLEQLANLKHKQYSLIALEARQLLMDNKMPSFRDRMHEVEGLLREMVNDRESPNVSDKVQALLDHSQPLFDILIPLLKHGDVRVREAALELYIRRIYRSYVLESVEKKCNGEIFAQQFQFRSPIYDALAVGIAPAESYHDLSSLLNKTGDDDDTFKDKAVTTPTTCTESQKISPNILRHGIIVSFSTLEAVKRCWSETLQLLPVQNNMLTLKKTGPVNVVHILLTDEGAREDVFLQDVEGFLKAKSDSLRNHGIRRVSIAIRANIVATASSHSSDNALYPSVYTFSNRLDYSEDRIVRHLEAPLAYKLELRRLRNYTVTPLNSENKNVHLYLAETKSVAQPQGEKIRRIFVRGVVRTIDKSNDGTRSEFDAYPGPERTLVDALNSLELAMGSSTLDGGSTIKNNHVFLNILPVATVDPQYLEGVIRILAFRYAQRLEQLRVTQVELKISARFNDDAAKIPVRLIASNPTGYVLRVDSYVEAAGHDETIFSSIGDDGNGELDGLPTSTPYPVSFPFDKKRELAKAMSNTVYAYDFVELFEYCVMRSWRIHAHRHSSEKISIPNVVLESKELILDSSGDLVETSRPSGQNTFGMVAWLMKMYTVEYPEGREIVVICNDITYKAGSFGTIEDKLFEQASKLARKRGIPRIFLAANAGARLGMAESIKSLYKVCWKDNQDPMKGFKYIYLTPQDYTALASQHAVAARLLTTENGEDRYILTDIIGVENDLGVECLQGSGSIAGETARAYHDIFTLTYVCGRSVGIGAYLVRLGHRTIQNKTHSPIILTGFQALNKLMGREVYTSNDQLGGVKVMHTNGITHMTSKNPLSGVSSILEWLSFVPAVRHGPLPIRDISGWDVVERTIDYVPCKSSQYDPRALLCGKVDESSGQWLSGMADKDSFIESLDGWAKSVIVGRARIGGIPFGAIITEVRTSEKIIPADPASPSTQENIILQAGQVWFPDSAHKTATAINDFKGEDLPLFIFANWRGFSGGQRDMFDEVLKFGAAIVDGLVGYEQPVFVYIPPYAELRGGAWAVVDSTINKGIMEMYADSTGRGGVLEPAGLIEIKYRKKQVLELMHRLDAKLKDLTDKAAATDNEDTALQTKLRSAIKEREDELMPMYIQITTEFAELHDTPGRMKAKHVIRDIVEWKNARKFFYWRLKRKLGEFALGRDIAQSLTKESSTMLDAEHIMKGWFAEAVNAGRIARPNNETIAELWEKNDKDVLMWLSSDKEWLQNRLRGLWREHTINGVVSLGLRDPKAAVIGILDLLHQLPDKDQEEALSALRRGSIFHRSTSSGKLNSPVNK